MTAIAETVVLTITNDSVGIARAGFGTDLIISYSPTWVERTRTYGSLLDVAADFAAGTPEYLSAAATFGQSPHPESVIIGRGANKPTQKYQIDVSAVTASRAYGVNVVGPGITTTAATFTTAAADITITTVTNGAESFTAVAHGMATGDGPYRYSTGTTLPSGLAVDTDYWIIRLTADTFSLASSKANAIALTAVAISTDGSGTQTLRRVQNDVICAQIVQMLNAVTGKNYLATQVTGAGETDYVEVTGAAAGNWFSLEVVDVTALAIKQTHADPGIAADITAIALENDAWYALTTNYNSQAMVVAAAAAIQALPKIYIFDVNETRAITSIAGSATDTLDAIKTLGYSRVGGIYHPAPAGMNAAAWLGARLPLDPGSETWDFAQLLGVAAPNTTSTHRVNLRAKSANFLQVVAGKKAMRDGTMSDAEFIDTIRGLDWLQDDMTKGVFGALLASKKVPFTEAGIDLLAAQVKASLNRAAAMGILDAATIVITKPLLSVITTSDKALRILRNLKFSATLQGAIHKVYINGSVSV